MLKSILMVWVLVQDLTATQAAYEDYLGYQTTGEGVVTEQVAVAMDRARLTDAPYITMVPRSGPQVAIRLVAGAEPDYQPMRRLGWSAIELLVADPDQLKRDLDGSAFTHLQGPDFLTAQKNIYAMQVIGPNQELFYLTHMIDPSLSFLKPEPSPEPVGHTFIMVMGTDDMAASIAFFQRHFPNNVFGPMPYRIGVLSEAYGQPLDTEHELAMVSMEQGYGIEIDQYPAEARPIPSAPGSRGGVIMVSVRATEPGPEPMPWVEEYPPEQGRPVGGILRLPSGTPLEVLWEASGLPEASE